MRTQKYSHVSKRINRREHLQEKLHLQNVVINLNLTYLYVKTPVKFHKNTGVLDPILDKITQ